MHCVRCGRKFDSPKPSDNPALMCTWVGCTGRKEMTKPLTPAEVMSSISQVIPDFVIDAVNYLLQKHYRGCTVTILQKDIEAEIKKRKGGIKFEDWWLDFEPVYEKAGWRVKYDKPGFNETYDASYIFSKRIDKDGSK